MTLIWSSGQGEVDDFIFLMTFLISLYFGISRMISFVERSNGLSYKGIVKPRRDGFERRL